MTLRTSEDSLSVNRSAAIATMWLSNVACAASLLRPTPASLTKLWEGFACLFAVHCAAGLLRVASGLGPWANLKKPQTPRTSPIA